MDIRYILDQLHAERQRVNEVIETLEKLAQGIHRRRGLSSQMEKLAAEASNKGAPSKRGRKKPEAGE